MPIKVALPKGRLLEETAGLLEKAGWALEGYDRELRLYHIKSKTLHSLSVKVFHEKDIPIQVAIGNYDLGICGSDWVEELLVKYPSSALIKVKGLGFGDKMLFMVASLESPGIARPSNGSGTRIASEYPNLAEAFALRQRLPRFSIFPVWGAAEAYPPENADLALIAGKTEAELAGCGMAPVCKVLDANAVLIANRNSWESKDLFEVVSTIPASTRHGPERAAVVASPVTSLKTASPKSKRDTSIRLALPDGHQQKPTAELLTRAGIKIEGYPSPSGSHPTLDGFTIKVIRPQDMPLQVANGNFDLAITGRDWVRDHLYQFPSSPVRELADLKSGWVKLVAVVSQSLEAGDIQSLRAALCGGQVPLRVASEYINIADKYARDNHLGPYRVIPTWGATEAFLPDDADMLIENTETGGTIARHKLKIIDTLFESTACLIGNSTSISSPEKKQRVREMTRKLRAVVEERTAGHK